MHEEMEKTMKIAATINNDVFDKFFTVHLQESKK
jgi:hypothetical protein